jgi:hypothetical protein
MFRANANIVYVRDDDIYISRRWSFTVNPVITKIVPYRRPYRTSVVHMTERYLGVLGIAEALGVSRHAVHKWRSRYPSYVNHPFPEPDVEVDGAPGWRADRLEEMMQWREGLPGRGAGGGRPSAARQNYLSEALVRGMDRDEALRALANFTAEFPELTEPQVCAWVIEKWRHLP